MGPPHMGQTWPALGEHLAGGLIIDSSVWSRPIIAIKAARQALVEQSQVFGQKLFLVSVLCVPRKTLWEQGPARRGEAKRTEAGATQCPSGIQAVKAWHLTPRTDSISQTGMFPASTLSASALTRLLIDILAGAPEALVSP